MAEPARKLHLSYDEYLALERETDLRHEYLDGEAWAMAGGTVGHAAVAGRLFGLLFGALRGRPCQPFNSDLKILVPETGLAPTPASSVARPWCGPASPTRPATRS